MRRQLCSLLTLALAASAAPAFAQSVPGPHVSVSFDLFHRELTPYGRWHDAPNHGRVWVPRVDASWRPYSEGDWSYTSEGWEFDSHEPWGWATFHYGRWAYERGLGWVWVPGYEWAPSWVTWRYGDGVVAWAPLGPVGLNVSYYDSPSIWLGVRGDRFYGRRFSRHDFLPTVRVRPILRHTRYSHGPSRRTIERYAGRPVTVVQPRTRYAHQERVGRHSDRRRDESRAPGVRRDAPPVYREPYASRETRPAPRVRSAPQVRPEPQIRNPSFERREQERRRAPQVQNAPQARRAPQVRTAPPVRSEPRVRAAPHARNAPPPGATSRIRSAPQVRKDPPARVAPQLRRAPAPAPQLRAANPAQQQPKPREATPPRKARRQQREGKG